jgi:predicted dithiol-disulfide oxidoreductase (DUF899 family)
LSNDTNSWIPACRRVTLAEMFDGKDRPVLMSHTMGKVPVRFCPMWADGFCRPRAALTFQAAFVVVSNDAPDAQTAFATSRGWPFAMYSAQGTTFFRDMGFVDNDGWMPGVSVFERTRQWRACTAWAPRNSDRETISAQYGTSLSCYRKGLMAGSPGFNIPMT